MNWRETCKTSSQSHVSQSLSRPITGGPSGWETGFKLKYDESPSRFAFKFILRRYTSAALPASPTVAGVAATAAGAATTAVGAATGAAAAARSSGASLAAAALSFGGMLQASATAGLLHANGTSGPGYSINRTAKEFILCCMAPTDPNAVRGCLPKNLKDKSQKHKGALCLDWFHNMATADELKVLLLPTPRRSQAEPGPSAPTQIDEGPRRRVVDLLHNLIVARLVAGFREGSHKVPPHLLTRYPSLVVSSLDSHLSQLKKFNGGVTIHASTLASWRATRETAQAENDEPGSSNQKRKLN